MSNKMIVFGFWMLLVCMAFVKETEAHNINYGAIGRDVNPGCSQQHPRQCTQGPPANRYTRGCNAANHCRGGKNLVFSPPPVAAPPVAVPPVAVPWSP
ncbi:hypothetical protein EZV62_027094 [Acer yangbiense]|uniref:Uncharacterized protein n=1 Tax=Acer yangbiense TaxID=1000413 RepID=A0A5C7GTB1_9ROSI|nr:hypothetical protein EZV62_027094 [Acer yangbiense]